MIKKLLFMLCLASLCCTWQAQALVYEITGTVIESDGVGVSFFPLGAPVSGTLDINDTAVDSGLATYSDITALTVSYADFCFSASLACSGGMVIPLSSGSAELNFSDSGDITGGFLQLISMGPTDLNFYLTIDFDLRAVDVGVCGLGCQSFFGTSSADFQVMQPVPLPASFWLLVCAMCSTVRLNGRHIKHVTHS